MITGDNLIELRKWVAATAKLVSALRSRPHTQNLLRSLASNYRDRITEKRKTASATRWWRTKWRPKKEFAQLPPASQQKALKVKVVTEAYYIAIRKKLSPGDANLIARLTWLLIFRNAISERTVRRIIDRVETCGGPRVAPMEVYADGLSVPHRQDKKQKK